MNVSVRRLLAAGASAAVCLSTAAVLPASADYGVGGNGTALMEYLDRGIYAVKSGSGMFVSWRWNANDADNAEFRLYRDGTLIYTSTAGTGATCYQDNGGNANSKYRVDTVVNGTVVSTENCRFNSGTNYFDIPLNSPGSQYSPNDCVVGDVDGDGQYEIFLKWDPSNSQDNSKSGTTDKAYIDCVTLQGKTLWRIDLGINIRAGQHYTQMCVADFDGDGLAELITKTADGTKDGTGKVIGDASKDYRNSSGYVLSGPEYLTLFDGATGAALDTIDFPVPRGTVTQWGDNYGNRVDRFNGGIAYLDGVHPSAIYNRGYYTRLTISAVDVRDKKLVKRWIYDTGFSSSAAGFSCGNHNLMVADSDNDGKQEIFMGASAIDDNGKLLWSTGQGHGDAMHLGDLDPSRPGLELWECHESSPWGVSLIDAKTGQIIFHKDGDSDTGRCCGDNVWSGSKGAELWGARPANVVMNPSGTQISMSRPSINFLIYWDGDLERELLDGTTISKINANGGITNLMSADGCSSNNSTKAVPCLTADLFGDWREELILRTNDNAHLRVWCTTTPTDVRLTTLMHDMQYRAQTCCEQSSYNQPPHVSYYLGSDAALPARPNVVINKGSSIGKIGASIDTQYSYTIKNAGSGLYLSSADASPSSGTNVQQSAQEQTWRFESAGDGYYYIYSNLGSGDLTVDIPYGNADNGTSIGLWSNDQSDARKVKLVDNGDGTYTICTKVSGDNSCLGVVSGSHDEGADVIEWQCDGTPSQQWILTLKLDPLNGNLVKNLEINDVNTYASWRIDDSLANGDLVFGDREVVYQDLSPELLGAETIVTPCDAKTLTGTLAKFTAGADVTVSVLLDTRVNDDQKVFPAWLSGWTKTDLTAANNNNVSFYVYQRDFSAGETVTLGENGTAQSVVNYTVLVQARQTQPETTQPQETTTQPQQQQDTLRGDVDCNGKVNIADCVLLSQYTSEVEGTVVTAQGLINAEVVDDGYLTSDDTVKILEFIAGLVPAL